MNVIGELRELRNKIVSILDHLDATETTCDKLALMKTTEEKSGDNSDSVASSFQDLGAKGAEFDPLKPIEDPNVQEQMQQQVASSFGVCPQTSNSLPQVNNAPADGTVSVPFSGPSHSQATSQLPHSGAPTGPPTGPPSGLPSGPPSGPPTGLPTGPPTGPPTVTSYPSPLPQPQSGSFGAPPQPGSFSGERPSGPPQSTPYSGPPGGVPQSGAYVGPVSSSTTTGAYTGAPSGQPAGPPTGAYAGPRPGPPVGQVAQNQPRPNSPYYQQPNPPYWNQQQQPQQPQPLRGSNMPNPFARPPGPGNMRS